MLRALEEDFARIPALLGRPAPEQSAAHPRPVHGARAGARAAARRARGAGPRRGSARPLLSALIELATASAAETEAFGAALARLLRSGDVVLVRGELGSGKTTLVRGACRGARHRRARHEPDVHDRPPLPRLAHGRPSRPLPLHRARPGGVGRPRAVLRRHRRVRRVARGGRARAPGGPGHGDARARGPERAPDLGRRRRQAAARRSDAC